MTVTSPVITLQVRDDDTVLEPYKLRVLLPQLRVVPGQVIDSYRLLLDDFQRPREQLLSGRPAGGRRPGTIRACQNPGRRSHEPQQTLSSPANHAPRPACQPPATQDSAPAVTGIAKTYR